MAKIEIPTVKILELHTSRTKSGLSKSRLSRRDWNKVRFPEDKVVTKIFEDSAVKITICDRRDFMLLVYMEHGIETLKREEVLERLEQYMIENKFLQ